MRQFAILFALLCLPNPALAGNANGNGTGGGEGNVQSQINDGDGNANAGGHGNGNSHGLDKQNVPLSADELGVGTALSPEGAAAASDQNLALKAVQQGNALPLSEIAKRVNKLFSARILDAHLVQQKGGLVYRLTILTDRGVSRKVDLDAKTGTTLGVD